MLNCGGRLHVDVILLPFGQIGMPMATMSLH